MTAGWGRECQGRQRRGQAEVMGVILIFGITIISVTAIMVAGSTALTASMDDSEIDRAELAMTQFDSRTSLVALGSSQRQTGSIQLGGQHVSLKVDEGSGWMNVSVINTTDGSVDTVIMNVTMGALVYENSGVTIAYQGGGVWRQVSNGSVMVSPPEFHYRLQGGNDPTLTLPLVVVRGQTSGGEFLLERNTTVDKYPITSDPTLSNPLTEGKVEITVQSVYYRAWGSFFQERTDGNVTFNHARETATIELVIPTEEENPGVDAGVVSGAAGTTLNLKQGAVVDSYNSSAGDYASTRAQDTRVVAAGNVIMKQDTRIEGSLEAGEDVTMKQNSTITGNVQYGDSLSVVGGSSIGGWTAQNSSVQIPDSVKSHIDDKRVAFAANNDNNTATAVIEDIESGDCDSGCTLTAGRYYLDSIALDSGDSLTLDTTGGDIEIVVLNNFVFSQTSTIDIVGSNRTNIYLEGDFSARQDATVSVPGDRSTQFWVYMNPGSTAEFRQEVSFVGVIYGPGSGAQNGVYVTLKQDSEVFGAVVGDVDSLKQDNTIHYDEALASVKAVDDGGGAGSNVPSISYLHVSVNWIEVSDD